MPAPYMTIVLFGVLICTGGAAGQDCDNQTQFVSFTTDYSQKVFNVTSISSLVFQIITCVSGSISLSSDPSFPNSHLEAYELKVGYQSGVSLYQCHNCPSNTLLDLSPVWTMNGFDCNIHPVVLWMKWDSDALVVGEGYIPGTRPLVWTSPLLHPINYLGFASASQWVIVQWQIGKCSDAVEDVKVPDLTSVGLPSTFTLRKPTVTHVLDASSVTSLVFSTTACHNTVFVKAAATLDDVVDEVSGGPVFNFDISYTIIQITKGNPYDLIHSAAPVFRATCGAANITLWIDWTGGFLSMGTGYNVTSSQIFTGYALNGVSLSYFGFRATPLDTPTVTLHSNAAFSQSGTQTATTSPALVSTPVVTSNMWRKLDLDPASSITYRLRETVDAVVSDIGCGRQCLSRAWCTAFHYDPAYKRCYLMEPQPLGPPLGLTWIYIPV